MKLEICVDSLESAVIAAHCGADRLEVCEDLSVGGLTPSLELVKDVKDNVSIPVYVLIRPRKGNFIYDEKEMEKMLKDIGMMRDLKVEGLVFGVLNKKKEINMEFCKQLLVASSGLPVTFHRAFDDIPNKKNALEDLINMGFKRILTTGGPKTAEEGILNLKELISQARSRIIIMPGGDVTEKNISLILQKSDAKEIHSSGRTFNPSTAFKSAICSVKAIQAMKKSVRENEARKMLQMAAM